MNPEFQSYALNEAGIEKAKLIAEVFDVALNSLAEMCPNGREWSLVKTKMEEASFFAKKAMAKDVNNHTGVMHD